LRLLDEVAMREPERVLKAYPHELSGGMRQRVLIAAAFATEPRLIIADEPTTALDVTVQKQILRLIRALGERHGTSVLFVTHDLGVVAQLCDSLSLLYRGRIVEQGRCTKVLAAPQHAYARALLAATPRFAPPGQGLAPVPEAVLAAAAAEIAAFDAAQGGPHG
jgi:peptide/nickel transport system ATP-binding protein